jgi:hypothetical protein
VSFEHLMGFTLMGFLNLARFALLAIAVAWLIVWLIAHGAEFGPDDFDP